jgi:hypothetical protein
MMTQWPDRSASSYTRNRFLAADRRPCAPIRRSGSPRSACDIRHETPSLHLPDAFCASGPTHWVLPRKRGPPSRPRPRIQAAERRLPSGAGGQGAEAGFGGGSTLRREGYMCRGGPGRDTDTRVHPGARDRRQAMGSAFGVRPTHGVIAMPKGRINPTQSTVSFPL